MTAELVTLAESINAARILADANEATISPKGLWKDLFESRDSQEGIYGDLSNALKKTLALILGPNGSRDAYQGLMDGMTVQEAIDHVNSQRGPTVELSVQQTPINTRNQK